MRKGIIGLSLLLTISLIPAYSATPPKAGSVCSKLGIAKTYQGKKFTCIKSGKKLVWDKGVALKSAVPASSTKPTPTLTPSVTQTPTSTPTSSVTPTPTAQPSSSTDSTNSTPQLGQPCYQPLMRFQSGLICWQIQRPADLWQWTTYSTSLHTPFSIPKTVSWRKIDAIPVAGAQNQLQHAKEGIAKLSQVLNHYWIEIDVEGGKSVAAAVWAPKNGSNLPVLVYFHGTGGLMYEDLEFAAQVSKIGFISVVPIWWGPRPASVENFFPKSNQTLFEYSQGPIFTGANLETAKMLLPVLKAATEQVGANPSKLALSGNSRGGTLALNIAASTPEVSAVVPIVAPFLPPQLQGIVSTPTTQGWETQPKSILKELMQPTMVISALNDQVVPPASTRDYLGAAQATGKTNIQSTWIDGNHQLTFEYNPDFQAKTLKALTDFLLTNMK